MTEPSSLTVANHCSITHINNNEIYEKIRPLKTILNEDQAHGDDTHAELSKDQEQSFEFFSLEHPQKHTGGVKMTQQFTDTSNEILKTDGSNYNQKNNIKFSDNSLQQRLPSDTCEYEIDLGNGRITKSLSTYQSDAKQRTTSVISADSIQPITTYRLPFTNKFYNEHIYPKQENSIDHCEESNILFNSHDYAQQQKSTISLRTIAFLSIATTIISLLIVLIFFTL